MDATLELLSRLGFEWPHVTEEYMKRIAEKYDMIIAAEPDIGQLSLFSDLQIATNEAIVLYEALRLNKEVCIFSSDVLVNSAAAGLRTKVNDFFDQNELWNV